MHTTDDVTIRRENPDERVVVRTLNEATFLRADEADLVDRLRDEGAVLASFVAEWNTQLVGHVVFSRMLIETADGPMAAVALAPMAVTPDRQRRGIGGQLIRHGLDWLRGRGELVVLVLGHPDYYRRFGFSSDRACNVISPFPPDAFMALELVPGALDGVRGSVRYPRAFGL